MKTTGVRKIDYANSIVLKTLEVIRYFNCQYWIIENPKNGLLKEQPFMSGLNYYDVDSCKSGFIYRKRTRLWTNITTWTPRPLCKRDCGKIRNGRHLETAQRLPCSKKDSRGEGYIKHKQDDLYKVPTDLISELFVCFSPASTETHHHQQKASPAFEPKADHPQTTHTRKNNAHNETHTHQQ